LLRRAKGDLLTCSRNLELGEDEVEIDIAGYHLQQAVEKILKFQISMKAVKYPPSHDIDMLLEILDDQGIKYPDWVDEYSATLTLYATKTRYGKDIVASVRTLKKLMPLALDYLESVQGEEKQKDNSLTPTRVFPKK